MQTCTSQVTQRECPSCIPTCKCTPSAQQSIKHQYPPASQPRRHRGNLRAQSPRPMATPDHLPAPLPHLPPNTTPMRTQALALQHVQWDCGPGEGQDGVRPGPGRHANLVWHGAWLGYSRRQYARTCVKADGLTVYCASQAGRCGRGRPPEAGRARGGQGYSMQHGWAFRCWVRGGGSRQKFACGEGRAVAYAIERMHCALDNSRTAVLPATEQL